MNPLPDETAAELLEVVPLVMRTIRAEMRRHRRDLTVPQFRALLHMKRAAGASLGEVADYIGPTSATTSKLVDELVGRGLVQRVESPVDRRKVMLTLTSAGCDLLESARRATLEQFEAQLAPLAPQERLAIQTGLSLLRQVFNRELR